MAAFLPRNPLTAHVVRSKAPSLPLKTAGSIRVTTLQVPSPSRDQPESVTVDNRRTRRSVKPISLAQDESQSSTNSDYDLAYNIAISQLLYEPGPNNAGIGKNGHPFSQRNAEGPFEHHNTILQLAHHEELLQEKANSARRKQDSWQEGVVHESRLVETLSQNLFLQARDKRNQAIRQDLESKQLSIIQAQAERQARLAAEAERQRLALEEERQAREEAEEARRQQLAAEEEQIMEEAEEAEQRRRDRERECVACQEMHDMGDTVRAPCEHWYCRQSLQAALESGYNDRTPYQCCQTIVPIDNLDDLLSAEFSNNYRDLLEASSTINPICCSNRICSAFIPAAQARGPDFMECRRCGNATCRHCRSGAHEGRECIDDIGTQQARALAVTQGWQACPNCNNMVEKSDGCLHMTCRCNFHFCYACGVAWGQCAGGCSRRR